MEKQDLSDFDEVAAPQKETPPEIPASAPAAKPARAPMNPKKLALGCLFLFFAIFVILLIAMAVGLSASEKAITNLGLSPVSLKNWSIGMVSFFFGGIALASLLASIANLARRLLARKEDIFGKSRAVKRGILSFVIFVATLGLWFVIYDYFSQFQVAAPELPIEIVTEPTNTLNLTSPIQIEFSAERITKKFAADYDIVNYEWDRESDGKIDATGGKSTLYFPHGGKNNGIFDVNLTVKMRPKSGGVIETRNYQKQVSIAKQEIYGEITADQNSGEIPLAVNFDASEITDPHGAAITNFSWDLDGDGRPDRDGARFSTASQTFETIGEHVVTLVVTSEDLNDDGTHETKTFEKTISALEPLAENEIAIAATPTSGFAPLSVAFVAQQISNESRAEKYEWQIGDGLATLFGQRVKYTFEKPGNYPVALTIYFANGQTSSTTTEIVANDESFSPTAKISTDPEINRTKKAVAGPAPFVVKFDGTSSTDPDENIVKYEWDFDGDGFWDAEGSAVEHEFRDAGNFETTLRVVDADGNESRAGLAIAVGEENAVVDFGADKLSGAAPLTVNFDASGSRVPTGKTIVSYEWNFDSENNSRDNFIYDRAQTAHVFETVGGYLVKLILHADDGTEYSDTLKIVAANSSLAANFSLSRTSGVAPLAVSFDAGESTGNFVRVEWDFGDGGTSTEKNPSHIFEKTGKFPVILRVFDSFGNVAQTSKTITVN